MCFPFGDEGNTTFMKILPPAYSTVLPNFLTPPMPIYFYYQLIIFPGQTTFGFYKNYRGFDHHIMYTSYLLFASWNVGLFLFFLFLAYPGLAVRMAKLNWCWTMPMPYDIYRDVVMWSSAYSVHAPCEANKALDAYNYLHCYCMAHHHSMKVGGQSYFDNVAH